MLRRRTLTLPRHLTEDSVTLNINRRQFVYQTSRAALFACTPSAFATTRGTYDLIIKGGRVIDASSCLNAVRDVAISRGRIVAISASVTGESAEIIDARGKLVVPGLIDIHTHMSPVLPRGRLAC